MKIFFSKIAEKLFDLFLFIFVKQVKFTDLDYKKIVSKKNDKTNQLVCKHVFNEIGRDVYKCEKCNEYEYGK